MLGHECLNDLGTRLRVEREVFAGQIFGPYSNPPHKVVSKPIPPQIKKMMDIHPNPYRTKHYFYLYRVKILAVFVANYSNLAHISQTMLCFWDIALLLCCLYHVS